MSRAREAASCDAKAVRREYLFSLPDCISKQLLGELRDPRDAPILFLFYDVAMVTLPSATLVYLAKSSHWLGLLHVCLNYVLFLQRFMLALHYSEHRKLFKKDSSFRFLASMPSIWFCPLFGVPSGMYKLHHVVMHHVENNHFPWDISSTEPYQRDNLFHFLHYLVKYMVGGWFLLPLYAAKRKLWKLLAEIMVVESAFVSMVYSLYQWSPIPTIWVFIVPFCITSFALMFGNWSQHIFIDPQAPQNCYRMTYNCVNCTDNQKSFNDGYHILHHVNSKLHWSLFPLQFSETIEKHKKESALVFEGIGFFDVGVAVFLGRLDWLADHCLPLDDQESVPDKDALIRLMKERLRAVGRSCDQVR